MIDLENKYDFASGLKSKNIYKPNQNNDFKISRSKFDDFRKCPRCFYCDVVKGFVAPGTPGWALNTKTDELLKKEFDQYREQEKPHPVFIEKGLKDIIPYKNNNLAKNVDGHIIKDSKYKKPYKIMDAWRTNSHGISIRFKNTNLILYGSVDDIWFNAKTDELIVADYKSQGTNESVNPDEYFSEKHKLDYKRQLNFYAYLLRNQKEKYKVHKKGYLYVVNARGLEKSFENKLIFENEIVPVAIDETDQSIEIEIQLMLDLMNSEKIPKANPKCKNCAYSKRRACYDIGHDTIDINNFTNELSRNQLLVEAIKIYFKEKKI